MTQLGGNGGELRGDEESIVGMAIPVLLVQLLRGHVAKAARTAHGPNWGYPERLVNVLENHLSGVCASFEHLERLITLPFPLAYLQHSKILFLIFALVYPLCIDIEFGLWANVISPCIIFFALLGFELLADEMENPLGNGYTDLSVLEMIHALEIRASKAFALTETRQVALQEDARGLLKGLGLAVPPLPEPPDAVGERLERCRRFSQHFCWLPLPPHVVCEMARQETVLPPDLSTPREHERLPPGLHLIQDGGRKLRRCWQRRRRASSGPDYGMLQGSEEEAVETEKDAKEWQEFLANSVSHFVCLRSQEETMRSICAEMQGCLSEEARHHRTVSDPGSVGGNVLNLVRCRSSGSHRRRGPGEAPSTGRGSHLQSSQLRRGPRGDSASDQDKPRSHLQREPARDYTPSSAEMYRFAIRFTPSHIQPVATTPTPLVQEPVQAASARSVGASSRSNSPPERAGPRLPDPPAEPELGGCPADK